MDTVSLGEVSDGNVFSIVPIHPVGLGAGLGAMVVYIFRIGHKKPSPSQPHEFKRARTTIPGSSPTWFAVDGNIH